MSEIPLRGRRVRAAALVCALAFAWSAGQAIAGTLSPTPEQVRALVQGDPDEPLALVRLLRAQDPTGFTRYMLALETEVRARGGERVYGGRIAQDVIGGELPYDTLIVDVFPTRRDCVESLRAVDPMILSLGVQDEFVLAVRPWGKAVHLAARALAALLGSVPREIDDPPPFSPAEAEAGAGGPEISPDGAAAEAFMQADQGVPIAMLDLNQLRARAAPPPGDEADAGVDGETAYGRYGRSALWHILRRGGSVLFAGTPIGVAIGAAGGPLDRSWNQLVLVYYPSRRHMRAVLADPGYRAALPHRTAGLERAVLLATEPWPTYDPARTGR
jgi:uncharacterized protein (DUF1330 family)